MADNSENILVEFDYNNIIVVDPNKIIDEDGRAKERLIKMENLVYYANLECKVIPRTKLALGVAQNDAIQTISVASLNFLQPGNEEFYNTKWTDEITGKDTLKGKGVNQPKKEVIRNANNDNDYYLRQTIVSGGKPGAVDNGLLGITNISVRVNTAFEPVITMKMEDIRGKALFESGDNSPYAVFFNLPYPLFYLTLKGYLGKAVRLPLMLTKFGASFSTSSGNFEIDLTFYTYKYNVLTEITMGGLLAAPHMYKTNLKIQERSGVPNQTAAVQNKTVTRGYQKIQEVYSEYKSKGLITDDFPELTLIELRDRLDVFIKNKLDTFVKENMEPISECEKYKVILDKYRGDVFFYGGNSSWRAKYLDLESFFVLVDKKTRVYTFNKTTNDTTKRTNAENELEGKLIGNYNKILKANPVLGEKGEYKIGKKPPVKSAINFSISLDTFKKDVKLEDIDVTETFIQRNKRQPTTAELEAFKAELQVQDTFQSSSFTTKGGDLKQKRTYFFFEGDGSFDEITKNMETQVKKTRENIETALTEGLADLLQNNNNGIGFVPTIRNVLAVFFANGEAFLRLMDDVHTKAWNERNSEVRKQAIFDPQVAGASQDNINPGDTINTPVYPWPQFIVATNGEEGQEKYEIRYPGDESLIKRTQGYRYDKWPEIEFVEEFINGLTERDPEKKELGPTQNELLDIKRASINAIEFPITNQVFSNKEEIKFFFEIYERLIYLVNYSKITRANKSTSSADEISNVLAEFESANILDSLGVSSPFIILKLKNLGFNSQTFPIILRQLSNDGIGESWQNYIRGIFNTRYIRNQIANSSFEFIKSADFNSKVSEPQLSIVDEEKLEKFINESTLGNKIDFTDLFPFTNLKWVKSNLANGNSASSVETIMDTKDTLFYNKNKKVITNFKSDFNQNTMRPITHFVFENPTEPEITYDNLKTKLQERSTDFKKQLITEGNLYYENYNGVLGLANQTSSMFNSPYFTNSIQESITKFRNGDPNPFTVPAYLFLNSLPLATPKEIYKTLEGNVEKDLGYIFASLKKYSAIHKLPYAWILKIGSVWHRYKKYVESSNNFDILDNSWKNFNSLVNYDPVTSAATKNYSLTIDGANIDIVLEDVNVITLGSTAYTSTIINVGFYPKLINDFNVFYQGYEIIKSNQQISGIANVSNNVITIVSVNLDEIQIGSIIGGVNFLPNTTILSQLNGTPGGVGQYTISLPQTVTNSNFFLTNTQSPGYTDALIQDSFNSGLTMTYVEDAIINESNGNRTLNTRIIPWSVSVKTPSGKFWYQIPSSGSLINQTKSECFKKTATNGVSDIVIKVTGNTSIHNGAVRNFWTAPNYGYFDNGKLTKPPYNRYLKYINPSGSTQENFSFGSPTPTNVEELLSIFSKNELDGFENEFLKFSKSIYDVESDGSTSLLGGISETPSRQSFKNFQSLMRDMMRIDYLTGTTGDEVVKNVQTKQFSSINSYLSEFLKYDIIFKFGNPSHYDRQLFSTFSNTPIVDPITWEKYQIITPNTIPVNGNPTLLFSRVNYPLVWKALETYVGFSTIPELVYKNSGSYITDFFIDLNVAFTEDNVKKFAGIIKIYATQKLNQFQEKPIEPAPPPPTVQPQVVGITTLKNLFTIDIESYENKFRAVYKNSEGLALYETDYSYPSITVRRETNFIYSATTLAYYSALTNSVISTTYGSISTNSNDPQFIVSQEFVQPKTFTPIPNTTQQNGKNAFAEAMSNYLLQVQNFQDKIINNLMAKLQKSLANVDFTAEPIKLSKLTGEPQPKSELWETFKALNDKWISGNDYKTKTLFEDLLLLDRANKNIGDKVLVDVFGVSDLLVNINATSSLYTYVLSVLQTNHFVVLTIPNYVNFYNVQEVVKDPKPRIEGTTDFANTLFGTFLSVDYRDSTAKLVCTFAGKASEQLDIKSVDYRFRSDSFDLTRASDNPLVENQINKNDWDISNRVVGFNVDIGPQNQGVFKSFSIGQNSALATSESLEILNQMANQGNNRGGATQSVSLYNLYKNRSYTCNIDMLGNALIQPTMYFNLRNVPMFSGSYYITSVDHTISNGSFQTSFEGVRQPVANVAKIDSYLQNLRTNLVSKIDELLKQQTTTNTVQQSTNVNNVTNNVTTNIGNGGSLEVSSTTSENCKPDSNYSAFVNDTNPPTIDINYKTLFDEIKLQCQNLGLNNQKTKEMCILIFYWAYVNSNSDKNNLKVFGNNPSLLSINQYWGTIGNGKYFCTTRTNVIPYVEFASLTDYVTFLIKRWKDRVDTKLSQDIAIIPTLSSNQLDPLALLNGLLNVIRFCYVNSFADSNTTGEESWNKLSSESINNFEKLGTMLASSIQILKPLLEQSNL